MEGVVGHVRKVVARSLQALIVPVAAFVAWQLLADHHVINTLLLPPPTSDASAWWHALTSGSLKTDAWFSLRRVVYGLLIGVVLGVVIGFCMAMSRIIDGMLNLPLQVLRAVPPITWIGFAILWFGIDDKAVIFLIALGVVFPMAVATYVGMRQIDRVYILAARNLGATGVKMVQKVILPAALPSILTGIRLCVALAWILVIVGELVGVSVGLGAQLTSAQQYGDNALVIAYMATIGTLGFLFDLVVRLISRVVLRWQAV